MPAKYDRIEPYRWTRPTHVQDVSNLRVKTAVSDLPLTILRHILYLYRCVFKHLFAITSQYSLHSEKLFYTNARLTDFTFFQCCYCSFVLHNCCPLPVVFLRFCVTASLIRCHYSTLCIYALTYIRQQWSCAFLFFSVVFFSHIQKVSCGVTICSRRRQLDEASKVWPSGECF